MKRRDVIARRNGIHLAARRRRIAVRVQTSAPRIVLDQKRHSRTDDDGENPEDQIRLAPSERIDQPRGERRHDESANSDAADGEPRGETAASDEPSRHRTHRRDIGATDAQPDAQSIRDINLHQIARHARGTEPDPGQNHADDGKAPGAPAVGERPGDDAEPEIQKTGERKDERNRAARGGKIML